MTPTDTSSQSPRPSGLQEATCEQPRTVFITCAALGKEVRAIIAKHGWDADFQAIDAKLHLYPPRIVEAVENRLDRTEGRYDRRIVVYGHCGAFDLDSLLERRGAVRPLGPHCYEQYGGERFAQVLEEEPGTYILTDFLVRAWDAMVVRGFKLDQHPELKPLLFGNYRRMVYFAQEDDPELLRRAEVIAGSVGLQLEVELVGYGDLERRLVAIMEDRAQPTAAMTHDGQTAPGDPNEASPSTSGKHPARADG